MKREADRREFSRAHTDLIAELKIEGIDAIRGRAHEVSMRGTLVECEASVPDNSPCDLTLRFGDGPGTAHIEAHCHVVRCGPGGIAVEIDRIDREGYNHLRKLVLLNSEDPDSVEDEFEAHIGLRRRG